MNGQRIFVALVISCLLVIACSPISNPENVVRTYVDAVNARDRAKFISLWSPDERDKATESYDLLVDSDYRVLTLKSIVPRDSVRFPNAQEVTVQVTESCNHCAEGVWVLGAPPGQRDTEYVFVIEKLRGRWYVKQGGGPWIRLRW